MAAITKECIFCSKSFIAKRKHARFCTDYCGLKYRNLKKGKKTHLITCQYCGIDKHGSSKNNSFCSIACANKARKNNDVEKKCLSCKKTFVVSFYKRNDAKYCSYHCSGVARWEMLEEAGRKKEVIEKIKNSHIEGHKTGKINRFGENSPGWKGGKTKVSQAIRNLKKMQEWRKQVFERDDYTCKICNKRGGFINADHIKSLRSIIIENNIATPEKAVDCSELWNIDNGRTLCVDCHRQTVSYGKG